MVDLPAGLGAIYGFATGTAVGGWLNLGINLILSTVIGGLVLLVILGIMNKAWGDVFKASNAFLVVLVINAINIFGILGLMGSFFAFVPWLGLLLPLIVWIVLIKVFFRDMSILHAAVLGVIGFILSIYLIPNLVNFAMAFIPI